LTEAANTGDKLTDAQNQQIIKVAQTIAKGYEAEEAVKPKLQESPSA
jgi:hypothetical protein